MIPNKHRIDLSRYPRRALLEAFKDRELPCFSVTCNVEIGALRQRLALTGHRFFITMSWILSVAANRIPELRHRLIDGELYEFERVDPGYTVLLDDHTFSFCDSVHREDFDVYYADVECRIAAARADPDRSTGDKHHMIFITNVPWLSFTAVTHPFSAQYASIPNPHPGQILHPRGAGGPAPRRPGPPRLGGRLARRPLLRRGAAPGCRTELPQAESRSPGPPSGTLT
ncbi:MAG: CatA-like O-acetyltransferase [Chromatiaceae bacterium]